MTPKLMLHCGGHEVTRTELSRIGTPSPTATWQPIPHASLVTEVLGALERNHLRVVAEQHALARDGDRYFGLMQIANGHKPGDHAWVLGLRNSHDQTFPAGLVIGSKVFVCDNLSFSGEIVLARRHTRRILHDLPRLVVDGVSQLSDRWHTQEERYARYREQPLTDSEANDLIIRALDAQAITTIQIPSVLEEWRRPRHAAFGERTAWSCFNAFTAIIGMATVWRLAKRTQLLHGVFDAHCGLTSQSPGTELHQDTSAAVAA